MNEKNLCGNLIIGSSCFERLTPFTKFNFYLVLKVNLHRQKLFILVILILIRAWIHGNGYLILLLQLKKVNKFNK